MTVAYRSQRFRSRLEARWAAFFDLLRWEWWYEPFHFGSWVPDFAIKAQGAQAEAHALVAIAQRNYRRGYE